MQVQSLIVAVLVLGSLAYASWTLMPAALRRSLACALMAWPLLRRHAWLQRAARPASACGGEGCGACDGAPRPPRSDDSAPIHIVRRLPR